MQNYNAPYAAPRPVFGKGCLFAFLGCLGVVLVASIVIGILIVPHVTEAAKGEKVIASSLRTYLPKDIPLYPGMTLNEQQTNSAWMVLRIAQSFDKKGQGKPPRQFVFTAPKDGIEVLKWYASEMPASGWKSETHQENLAGLMKIDMAMFRKGERALMIQTVQMEPRQVTFMYFEKMPKRKPVAPKAPDKGTP